MATHLPAATTSTEAHGPGVPRRTACSLLVSYRRRSRAGDGRRAVVAKGGKPGSVAEPRPPRRVLPMPSSLRAGRDRAARLRPARSMLYRRLDTRGIGRSAIASWRARTPRCPVRSSSMSMRIRDSRRGAGQARDVRLREVLDASWTSALSSSDGPGARVGHLLDEMDEWIGRAGEAERMRNRAPQLWPASPTTRPITHTRSWRRLWVAPRIAVVAPWKSMSMAGSGDPATDTAFAPPFGTIRQCRVCGCLSGRWPNGLWRCAEAGSR